MFAYSTLYKFVAVCTLRYSIKRSNVFLSYILQTGSGKTHTMMGDFDSTGVCGSNVMCVFLSMSCIDRHVRLFQFTDNHLGQDVSLWDTGLNASAGIV